MTSKAMVEPLNTKAWVLVPIEPTPEMLRAGIDNCAMSIQQDRACGRQMTTPFEDECGSIYRAMLSASPVLPAVDGGEIEKKTSVLAREYRPSMDKDIVHAWGADASNALYEAAALISSQKQEIDSLTNRNAVLDADGIAARKGAANNYARASAAESRVQSLEEALRKIADISHRNFGRQSEKLADIEPIARAALKENGQ